MSDQSIVQSGFDRTIDKAIAELQVAKLHGPDRAEPAIKQALYHLSLALDDTRRRAHGHASKTTQGEPA